MLQVELGLLANGGIRVQRRLDAVPQHSHVHGCGGWGACCVGDGAGKRSASVRCGQAVGCGRLHWCRGGLVSLWGRFWDKDEVLARAGGLVF
jgi:hypothetical protein